MKNNQNSEAFFGVFYKAAAVAATAVAVIPPVHGIVFYYLGIPAILSVVLVIAGVLLGYAAQSFTGRITHVKRETAGGSEDKGIVYFHMKDALIPLIAALILSFCSWPVTDGWLQANMTDYDPHSLTPLLVTTALMLSFSTGIVLWFFPYDRVISFKSIFPFLAVWLIEFVILYRVQGLTTVGFIVFLLASLLILNQSHLLRMTESAGVGKAPPAARLYNMAMVAVIVLAIALALLLVASAVVGLVVLVRIFLYFILASLFRDESSAYVKAEEAAGAAGKEIFSDIAGLTSSSGVSLTIILFVIFIVFLAGIVAALLMLRRVNLVALIGRALSALYNAVLRFLEGLFAMRSERREEFDDRPDYRDDEERLTPQTDASVFTGGIETRRTWREFRHRLSGLKDDRERLAYAYATLVSFWRTMGIGVRESDTPREVESAVVKKLEIHDIDAITAEYERIRYADDPDAASETLETVVSLVRRFYD